jgi:hypothetical protein
MSKILNSTRPTLRDDHSAASPRGERSYDAPGVAQTQLTTNVPTHDLLLRCPPAGARGNTVVLLGELGPIRRHRSSKRLGGPPSHPHRFRGRFVRVESLALQNDGLAGRQRDRLLGPLGEKRINRLSLLGEKLVSVIVEQYETTRDDVLIRVLKRSDCGRARI